LIGPAGENLCKFANIRTKLTNSLGRCGGGAVLGSKNVKAIVFKGSTPIKIAEPQKFFDICNSVQKDLMDTSLGAIHGASFEIMYNYGTPGLTRMIGQTGMTPIKNWQECGFWEKDEELDGPGLIKRWGMKRDACQLCPLHCHTIYHVEGKYATHGAGPEYETTCALGHKCLVADGAAVLKMNSMGNDLGFDTVELGNMFSTLMEWYDRGIIDESFTDGVPMTWGNADGMIELIPKIALRQGCGDELAKGPYWVGVDLGEEALKYVYHQKGMCATGVETRSTIGAMLSFGNSNRGSHHLSGLPTAEWVNQPDVAIHVAGFKEAGELLSYHPEAKSNLVRYYENLFELPDSLGICKFPYGHAGFWHDTPELIERFWSYMIDATNYATGLNYTRQDFDEIAERAWQLERAIIAMRGMRRVDDLPNWRCLNEECPGDHPVGPIPLPKIDLEKYSKIMDQYYKIRGWTNDAVPTRAKLEEVGLKEVADMMEKYI
jgi:aldehyde:ferredoxin oxidoreductase